MAKEQSGDEAKEASEQAQEVESEAPRKRATVPIPAVDKVDKPVKQTCGIVMPISPIDGCSESHWAEVKGILSDAIEAAGMNARLVSDADDVGIIQRRIIQNLYDDPIVVCDVSAKNPNVMFELGMRLAFDKPTIIVKDDKTSYSFDTSPIEHLEYPRDLRFGSIVSFKERLADKLKGTLKLSQGGGAYTSFLKHFGEFTVAQLETKTISKEDYIIEQIADLRRIVRQNQNPFDTRSIDPLGAIAANTIQTTLPESTQLLIQELLWKEIAAIKKAGHSNLSPTIKDGLIQKALDATAEQIGFGSDEYEEILSHIKSVLPDMWRLVRGYVDRR